MSPCYPFRPIPGQCGPHRRGPLPAPPFDPQDYWATRKLVSSLFGSLDTTKLDKVDVVDPSTATEDGKAADAKSTYKELNRIITKLAKKADKATTLAGYGITDAATKVELATHTENKSNPHAVTAEQINAYTKAETDAKIDEKRDIDDLKIYGKIKPEFLPITYSYGSEVFTVDEYTILKDPSSEFYNVYDEHGSVILKLTNLGELLSCTYGDNSTWLNGTVGNDLIGMVIADSLPDAIAKESKIAEKLDANKGLNFAPSKYSENNAVEIVNGWWLAVIGGFGNIWDVASDGQMRQNLSSALNGKADKATPSTAGNLATLTADGNLADSGKTVDDFLPRVSNGPVYSTFDVHSPLFMNMDGYIRLGVAGFIYGPFDQIREEMGSPISLRTELDSKAYRSMISATDPTFSNAVLAVGLNIDTNSVAVLNEIAATFGGFPIEGTATTAGGLLAALAAAIAWLKKNKVGSFESVGGASATVKDGVAKLHDFFTESNSLLTETIKANAGGDDEKTQIVFSEFAKMDGFTRKSVESDSFDVAITKLSQLLGEDITA